MKDEVREVIEGNKYWPQFDFVPLFFILDKNCKWVMVVRKQDKYEYKGVFIAYDDPGKWRIWAACKGVQQFREYQDTFDFTKEESQAFLWAIEHKDLPDTWNVPRERIADFPIY